MMDLAQERQPDPALKRRVVSALVAAGLVRRRRAWRVWVAAAAAAGVIAIGVSVFRPRHPLASGNTYALLLEEDSTFHPPPNARAELARWADSLNAVGKFVRAGRLVGPGFSIGGSSVGGPSIGGLLMIRAANDSDAARITATCPYIKWGHVEVKRFEE